MTTEEFKKENPEMAHLEGDALWDAMTAAQWKKQVENKKVISTLPFWKKYTLRYLFYVKPVSWKVPNKYEAKERCKNCKEPVSGRYYFMMPSVGINNNQVPPIDFFGSCGTPDKKDISENITVGTRRIEYCTNCGKQLILEKNKNIGHLLYTLLISAKKAGWAIIEFLHIAKLHYSKRYDMFGDESHYVWRYRVSTEPGVKTIIDLKKRKWFEYIFIIRKDL